VSSMSAVKGPVNNLDIRLDRWHAVGPTLALWHGDLTTDGSTNFVRDPPDAC